MIAATFTPVSALVGGLLIGAAASLLWWSLGRTAGISGIWADLSHGEHRAPFLGGLLVGAAILAWLSPESFGAPREASLAQLAAAGLLVGVGTRLGGGCTSGHGVCGLSRRSPRSLAAVVTFLGVAMVTATVAGGAR
jgi:hypothetical protein